MTKRILWTKTRNVLISIATGLFFSNLAIAQTYYSQGSGAFDNATIWNTQSNGSGSPPPGATSIFTPGTVDFVIQSGHSITSPDGNISINNLTIESTGAFDPYDNDIIINGIPDVSGTFRDSGPTGINVFEKQLIIRSGGSFTSTFGTHEYRGGIANSGNFSTGINTIHEFSTNTQSVVATANVNMSGSITFNANVNFDDSPNEVTLGTGSSVDINSGFTLTNKISTGSLSIEGNSLTVDGTLINDANAHVKFWATTVEGNIIANATGNTVEYFRNGIQDILNITYHNLTIGSISTANTQKNFDGSYIVQGNLVLNDINLNVTGTTPSLTLAGNLTGSGTSGITSPLDYLIMNGGSPQTINLTGFSTFEVGKLTIDNQTTIQSDMEISSQGLTVNAPLIIDNTVVNISNGDIQIDEIITIDGGRLEKRGDSNFSTSTSLGTTRMIAIANGGMVRTNNPSSGDPDTYPIGTGSVYTPVTVSATFTSGVSPYIEASVTASEEPNVIYTGQSLAKYWTVNSNNLTISGATIEMTYDDTEIVGNEAIYIPGYYDTTWSIGTTDDIADGSNIATFTHNAVSELNGNYTAGEPKALDLYLVTNTNDSGIGSLRWAMTNANASSGKTIHFDLPEIGPWTITPSSNLPTLTSTTIIDATTQTGWTSTNMINLAKAGSGTSGFTINANNCEIYGFQISGFYGSSDSGIQINTGINGGIIGSSSRGNVIRDNNFGIWNRADNIIIQGNKIGTNNSGTLASPNDYGIYISSGTGNQVGGSGLGEGNLLSGNTSDGIRIINSNGNFIQGNYIGTDITGVLTIPNEIRGIELGFNVGNSASSNVIGGSVAGEGNVIAGNNQANIVIFNGTDNIIQGNKIGVNVNGDILEYAPDDPTDYGIWLNGFSTNPIVTNTTIGGFGAGEKNVIAGSRWGITANPNLSSGGVANQNIIRGNTINCNITKGIQLFDNANNSIIAPEITGYTTGAGTASVTGTCVSCTTGDLIDVYRDNSSCNVAQGNEYLGTVTFSSSPWTLSGQTLSVGDRVTAMVTDVSGNSSEFFLAEPEINIYQGTDNSGIVITDAQTGVVDFGTTPERIPVDITFTIENTGLENLDIALPLTVSNSGFSIQTQPSATVNPLTATTFIVRLDASNIGTFNNRTVTISNDDADENPFTFQISGEVIDPYIVTNTNDSGIGSLRWAITNANANSEQTISFNIPNTDSGYNIGSGDETWTINLTTDLPDISKQVILDATTQPGSGNFRIVLNGSSSLTNGFKFTAEGSEIYGFYITGFTQGIEIIHLGTTPSIIGSPGKGNTIVNCTRGIRSQLADGHTIQGNYIGTDENGTIGIGNITGIDFPNNSGAHIIGGSNAAERNIISGNTGSAIALNVAGGTQIIGNYIGTDPSGMSAIPNGKGITVGNSSNSKIIDNLISGNTDYAIHLNVSNNCVIQGNFIGVASNGTSALGNGIGIEFLNLGTIDNNTIGGITTGEGNTIANNTNEAIRLANSGANGNIIIGNSIYCNGSGIFLNSIGNNNIQPPAILEVTSTTVGGTGIDGDEIHVYRDNSDCTAIGQGQEYLGTSTVSGGLWSVTGLLVTEGDLITATATNSTDGTSEFTGQNPFIVTNTLNDGTGSLRWTIDNANNDTGSNTITFQPSLNGSTIIMESTVSITSGNGNGTIINGDIDNNNDPDVTIQASTTGYSGLTINASNCQIKYLHIQGFSGTVQGAIAIDGSSATGNLIIGNYLGTNSSATGVGTSNYAGVIIDNGATGNFIGDGTATGRNVIGNNTFGIYIRNGSGNTTISGNSIGIALNGNTAIGNIGRGIDIFSSNDTKVGVAGELPNVISSNSNEGIRVNGSPNTTIVNNLVGVDISGLLGRGNGTGIEIINSSDNTQIGDGTMSGKNIISGNSGHGISIDDSDGTMVLGNYIGLGSDGSTELANNFGILIDGTSESTHIGNGSAGGRNIISANTRGIHINNGPTYVFGNFIGTDINGTADRGNQLAGVQLGGGTGSQIGGSSTGNRNIISGNGWGIGVSAGGNDILGNYIGTNTSGTAAIPNDNQGIRLSAGSGTNIGNGTATGANIISGNTLDGILIENASTTDNTLDFNYIGVQPDGVSDLGNNRNGILIESQANGNLISNNVIAYNVNNGIEIGEVFETGIDNNTLSQNSIYHNENKGILITNGAQNGISPPVISSVSSTTISGKGNNGDIIELFKDNTSANPQGEIFLGQGVVSSGTWSVSGSFILAETFTATATDTNGNTSEFTVLAGAEPEINLFIGTDNTDIAIVDAQINNIDFGTAVQTNDIIQTFAIENTGTSILNISSISVSGTGFTITSAITSIMVGATEIFTITLSGNNTGIFNSTITIVNDDADENPFSFPITGTITAPEINVFLGTGSSGTSITNGQTEVIDYGSSVVGNNIAQTFAIKNSGTSTLNINSITSSSNDYSVTNSINSIAVGETETFMVILSGDNAGTFNTTISVISDDPDEALFDFEITGTISQPTSPEIGLFVGIDNTGTSITNAQTVPVDFGSAIMGNDIPQNFTIENTGTSTLNISNISVSGTDFNVSNTLSSVAAGTHGVFTITLSGANTGRFNTTVTIINNDSDEGVFTYPITGLIEGMNVIDGNNSILFSNQEINLGNTNLGENIEKSFTIENLSVSNTLEINSIDSDNPVFELQDIPTSVAPEDFVQFKIVFIAENPGNYSGNISVSTSINDFTFKVSGEVLEGALPLLNVYNALTPNGDSVHDFFKIDNITFYPNNKVTIYNRWGDKVFELDGYDNTGNIFTGISNIGSNKELDTDNYYYTIDKGNGSSKETGFLYLKR
ncbi:choice-of-anchor D domain-containing protein [Reichenbachiella sp. MALMAid0571]|uniref:choice-of-anchor D domain-containing protein n=1 Tax=Reichenbachiella sp. MALMAid0571 TaxID=3143939 RepID=UPI0032DEA426